MKHVFGKVLLCMAFGWGSLIGVPMRPREIEELLRQMTVPKIALRNPEEGEKPKYLKELERLRRR